MTQPRSSPPRTPPPQERAAAPPLAIAPRASSSLPWWAVLCFFASGAAGLLYEVVWSKELSLVLGNSLHAISTVVAAFLCGLALGAWKLGTRLARPGEGPRRYAFLELGIALFGVVSVPVMRSLGPVTGMMYHALGEGGPAFAAARFALVFVLLLPPTLLMGATLPVLVDHFERALVGPALARLYAINTAGAVAGSLLGGFLLVPGLGLFATALAAAGLNVLAAIVALTRSGARTIEAALPGPAASQPAPARQGAATAMGALLAFSGFAALAFQIAWVRLFGLVLGSSVYSFSAVLGVYLTGLAVGSALAGRWLSRSGSTGGFAVLQGALALVAASALWFFRDIPDLYLAIAQRAGGSWGALFVTQLSLVLAVVFVPCVLLGAVFPLAARLMQTRGGADAVGRAYAVNTFGTITGSLAAGYVLVPALGVQGTHTLALGLSAAVALAAAALAAGREARRAAVAAGLAIAAAVVAATAPAWDPLAMSAGVFRPAVRAVVEQLARERGGSSVRAVMGQEEVLLYREGLNASVLVTRPPGGGHVVMRIGGKVDASTVDMATQVLSGLLPAALADSGARALVIGQGSGVTLSSVLAAGAGRTDLAELEPAVLEGSRFFHAKGRDPLDDPRTHVYVEDGRTVLAHARERYGLIVSEPSNPWLAGLNNLFTADFYRLVRGRLVPNGVFCQWIQLYEISPQTFGSILGGFLEVFPRGNAFLSIDDRDLLLVACDSARTLSLPRLSTPAARAELGRAKLLGPGAVAAFFVGPIDSMWFLTRGVPVNRDDRPFVEYRAPREMVELGEQLAHGGRALGTLLPRGRWADAQPLFADWTREDWFDGRVRQMARLGMINAANIALADARASRAANAEPLEQSAEAEQRGRALTDLLLAARNAAFSGGTAESRDLLLRAAEIAPANGRVWVLLAEQQRKLGELDAARQATERALAVGQPDEKADALIGEGLAAVARRDLAAATRLFAQAQKWAPANAMAYVFEARARLDLGDRAGATEATRRGLAHAPRMPEMEKLRAELGL